MKNAHHLLPHAILVVLWVFSNLQGIASKLDLDLNGIIYLIPKKNVKISKLVFSFVIGRTKLKKNQ
jgi:hypothetical protein